MIIDDITCMELVELVTEYLEGTMSPDDRARFESHLAICDACVTYVDQLRRTIAATGSISAETIDPAARDELLSAFRDWKRGPS